MHVNYSFSVYQAILDTTTWYLKLTVAQTQLKILSFKPAPPPVFYINDILLLSVTQGNKLLFSLIT